MEDLYEMIERVSPRATTVLIRGESGTGKELCARAIHQLSGRRGPFIPFNVAAVPDDLLESELFGHTKGAFTGASQERKGLFETSSGGTLFLDEIAEMSPSAQAKILRALEERKIRRIGDSEEIAIDVRLVSATHRDLYQRVQEGTFREDLYYRLKVVELRIPPLRDRQEDIEVLADHFLADLSKDSPIEGFDPVALSRLKAYNWPGNVRELRNAIEHATIMARNSLITEEDLPPEIVPENLSRPTPSTLPEDPDLQKQEIINALEQAHWHRGEAADLMGLSRRHLYRLIKKHGIADKGH
jgi:DNA-binding NtrC family response regulator